MAYRRRQQTSTSNPTSFDDEEEEQNESLRTNSYSSSTTSMAAKAIRASSAARRDSSLYSAYGFDHRSPSSPTANSAAASTSAATSTTSASSFSSKVKDQKPYEYTSMKPLNEPKQGFWGSLARKAKSVLEDDSSAEQPVSPGRTAHRMPQTSTERKFQNPDPSQDNHQRTENRTIHKGLNAISSSLNYIGNAVEEGLSKVENRTADIIQETRKHIRKKPGGAAMQNQVNGRGNTWQQPHVQPQVQTDQELQLKASRDVAMAMAAKAKLLLRELKTVKADLAFAKERCGQLEEENKMLREHNERGDNPEDDDLIRLQLETLLSEKARLAHENSIYARENRFLREVVEYHQLTMQDVVYLDEGTEEVTEVYPIKVVSNTPSVSHEASLGSNLQAPRDISLYPVPPPGILEHPRGSISPTSPGMDTEKHSNPWV